MVDKVDPVTGERWRKVPRLYERPGFAFFTILVWLGLAFFLWWVLTHTMPLLAITPASQPLWGMAQALALGKGFSLVGADGQWWPIVTIPPVFPVIAALMMVARGSTDIGAITPWLQGLDLGLLLLATFLLHRLTGHYFKSPYPALISLLFVLSPLGWHSVAEGTQYLLFQVFALSAILMIDDGFKGAGTGTVPGPKQQINIGCWLLLAVATHPAGWALALAWLLMVLRWMGPRRWAYVVLSAVVVLSPWWIRATYTESVFYRQHPGYAGIQRSMGDYRLNPSVKSRPLLNRTQDWVNAAGMSLLGVAPDDTLHRLPMPAVGSDSLQVKVRKLADTIADLVRRLWWLHWAIVLMTLWGALNMLLRRSGILGAAIGLWAGLSIFLFPLNVQAWVTLLYPALLLCWIAAVKGIGDSLQPSRVPVLSAGMPTVILVMAVSSLLQYISLLHHGSDWIATHPSSALVNVPLKNVPPVVTVSDPPTPEAPVPTAALAQALPPVDAQTMEKVILPPAPPPPTAEPALLVPAPPRATAKADGPKLKLPSFSLPFFNRRKAPPPSLPASPSPAAASPPLQGPPSTKGYQRWLTRNTRLSDTLIFHSPKTLHEATNRSVYDLPASGRPAATLMLANQAQFLVQDTQRPESAQVVEPLLAEYSNRFRLAYANPAEHVKIWQILARPKPNASLDKTPTPPANATARAIPDIATSAPLPVPLPMSQAQALTGRKPVGTPPAATKPARKPPLIIEGEF